jgi:hypothetical protein
MAVKKANSSGLSNRASFIDASAGTSKIADIPNTPTIGTATIVSLDASVPFTAATDGGNATSFSVISDPGNIVVTTSSSPASFTGLTNNTNYTFRVKAINSSGESSYGSPSNSVLAVVYAPSTVSYLVVGGGAGSNSSSPGGSGAGRVQSSASQAVSASTDYSISIGGGGTNGGGGTSSALSLSSGSGSSASSVNGGASGNGFAGGGSSYSARYYSTSSGGGGGAGGAGSSGSSGGNYPGSQEPNYGGPGGVGLLWNGTYFGGGGGGSMTQAYGYYGGPGGGGQGGGGGGGGGTGGANTGGGGGGPSGSGGSGIVIIRYADTAADLASIGAGLTYSYTNSGGFKQYRFTGGTGNIRW